MNSNNLPLNVLWVWNCNENTIAQGFRLDEKGTLYQVLGANYRAFNEKGQLKIAPLEEPNEIHSCEPDTSVFIDDLSLLEEIWEYWHKLGGAQSYKNLVAQTRPPEPQPEIIKNIVQKKKDIDLTKAQINDLAYELEFLLTMEEKFKGQIDAQQIERLISVTTEGFTGETVKAVREELQRRGKV